MEGSVIISPVFLLGTGLALLFCLFDLRQKASGYLFSVLSAFIEAGMVAYALLKGAPMQEVLIVVLVFFALHLTVFVRKGGKG